MILQSLVSRNSRPAARQYGVSKYTYEVHLESSGTSKTLFERLYGKPPLKIDYRETSLLHLQPYPDNETERKNLELLY